MTVTEGEENRGVVMMRKVGDLRQGENGMGSMSLNKGGEGGRKKTPSPLKTTTR